jgi:hypothetical protein
LTNCQSEKSKEIKQFWLWFETVQFELLQNDRQPIDLDSGYAILKTIHKDITFSMDRIKEDGSRNLTFSVNWNKDAIPYVDKLVAAKPDLVKWHIKSLDNEISGGQLVFMENGDTDLALSPKEIFFSYDKSQFDFFIEGYDENSKDLKGMVTTLIHGEIGELNAVTYIEELRLHKLDSSQMESLKSLSELDKKIQEIKN